MSYIALYRKFRPDSFDEIKGQEHIVTTLQNQIKSDRVGHAYLFCGTRGTGKTTMAKLLAKIVNCDNPTDSGPCGVCPSCKAIADGSSLNVMEIDAASNNGVDNIRLINESVQYSPAQGKYIVYIIDEVHMLSANAYNALLKTLEEPPEYVIFILATTDVHKIPVTIKSRCQRYDFHRISIDTITDRLEEIVKRENASASRDALSFIARTADGSMRDALSILDECMSATINEKLTKDKVLATIGAVSVDVYLEMMEAIKNCDANRALSIIKDTIYNGKDLIQFVDDFTWFMRNVLFLKLSPDLKSELDMTEESAEDLIKLGNDYTEEAISRYLNILQHLSSDMRPSSVKRILVETAVIKMMHPETENNLSAVFERLDKLERGGGASSGNTGTDNAAASAPGHPAGLTDVDITMIESLIEKKLSQRVDEEINRRISSGELFASPDAQKADPKKQSEIVLKNIRERYEPAVAKDIEELAKTWNTQVVPKLTGAYKEYSSFLNVEPSPDYQVDGPARLRLVFDEKDTENVRYGFFSKEEHRSRFADIISEMIGKQVELDIVTRRGSRSAVDQDSQALNKIKFNDIKVVDTDEDIMQ